MIYPRIVLKEYLEKFGPLAVRPWVDGHIVCLVEDLGSVHRYMQEDEIGGWEAAYAKALENLKNQCNAKSVTQGSADNEGRAEVLVFEGHDHVGATPLLEGFHKACEANLGKGYCFSIPAFDELVAYRESGIDQYGKTAFQSFKEARHPVSPHIFHFEGGQVKIKKKRKWTQAD